MSFRDIIEDGYGGPIDGLTRPCSRCKVEFPVDSFPANPTKGGRADGKHSQCAECKALSNKESRERHPEKARARTRAWWAQCRKEMFDHYGRECACCGESRQEFLCIDHVDGGGNAHRAAVGGSGSVFYAWLRRNGWPEGFRTLCHNCNQARGLYGYCPHERERQDTYTQREVVHGGH